MKYIMGAKIAKHRIWLKIVTMAVVCALMSIDIAFALDSKHSSSISALAATSIFKPIARLNWDSEKNRYLITEDQDERDRLVYEHQEEAALKYLDILIGQFQRDLSGLSRLGVSEGGLIEHLEETKKYHLFKFIESIREDLPHVNFRGFRYEEMYWDGNAVCLPYERRDDRSVISIRRYGPVEILDIDWPGYLRDYLSSRQSALNAAAEKAPTAEAGAADLALFKDIKNFKKEFSSYERIKENEDAGILDERIPEWKAIKEILQWGSHINKTGEYTKVGEHTMGVLRVLNEEGLLEGLAHPEDLLIAAFFHDFGKIPRKIYEQRGMVDRHSVEGSEKVYGILLTLGFSKEEAERYAWYVKQHGLVYYLSTGGEQDNIIEGEDLAYILNRVTPDDIALLTNLTLADVIERHNEINYRVMEQYCGIMDTSRRLVEIAAEEDADKKAQLINIFIAHLAGIREVRANEKNRSRAAFDISEMADRSKRCDGPWSVDLQTLPPGLLKDFIDFLNERQIDDVVVGGGAIRDTLLGNKPNDIDFAVKVTLPEKLMAEFEKDVVKLSPEDLEKKYKLKTRAEDVVCNAAKRIGISPWGLLVYPGEKWRGVGIDWMFSYVIIGDHMIDTDSGQDFTINQIGIDRRGRVYQQRDKLALNDWVARRLRLNRRPAGTSLLPVGKALKAIRHKHQLAPLGFVVDGELERLSDLSVIIQSERKRVSVIKIAKSAFRQLGIEALEAFGVLFDDPSLTRSHLLWGAAKFYKAIKINGWYRKAQKIGLAKSMQAVPNKAMFIDELERKGILRALRQTGDGIDDVIREELNSIAVSPNKGAGHEDSVPRGSEGRDLPTDMATGKETVAIEPGAADHDIFTDEAKLRLEYGADNEAWPIKPFMAEMRKARGSYPGKPTFIAKPEPLARERFIATNFIDALIIWAWEAAKTKDANGRGQSVILGLDDSWIPDKSCQQAILTELERLEENLKKIGLDNVMIERGKGDDLAAIVKKKQEKNGTSFSNIIILGGQSILRSAEFNKLKGESSEDSALLIGVNAENASGAGILEMFLLAMKLNSGRSPSELTQSYISIVPDPDGRPRAFIFNQIKPYDTEQLREVNRIQIEQINSNA